MAKLTDKQRKKIIAERAEGASLRCLAKKYGVSSTTISRTLKNDPETVERVTHKKEENIQSVLAYMDTKKNDVCALIDALMAAIADPAKIADASIVQLATVMGILVDKYTAAENATPGAISESNLLEALRGCEEDGLDDLPETQQAAKADHDMVENAEPS